MKKIYLLSILFIVFTTSSYSGNPVVHNTTENQEISDNSSTNWKPEHVYICMVSSLTNPGSYTLPNFFFRADSGGETVKTGDATGPSELRISNPIYVGLDENSIRISGLLYGDFPLTGRGINVSIRSDNNFDFRQDWRVYFAENIVAVIPLKASIKNNMRITIYLSPAR
ncbi:MAG: hypothetical protein ACK5KN_04095 [Dysgonomonas sp.]|uniref:hypothetical protein n=1 Tax=Dysgonomonas sp. TaxID=1891233 RepID=UPI003A891DAD